MVMGNLDLNAVTVALLYNVAVKIFVPTVIFSFILSVIKTLCGLLVASLFLLQQAKSWMQIKQDINVMIAFIVLLDQMFLICFAGMPPTTVLAGTSFDTTAPAATTAFSPMVTPCKMVT